MPVSDLSQNIRVWVTDPDPAEGPPCVVLVVTGAPDAGGSLTTLTPDEAVRLANRLATAAHDLEHRERVAAEKSRDHLAAALWRTTENTPPTP